MDREVVDRWCERGVLTLVLAILIFGPLAFGAVRGLEFGIIEGLTVGVVVLWLARLWINPRPQLLWPPICWGVLAFCVYAIIRYRTADIEYIARHEMLRVLVYGFLFLAILNNLHRQESTQIIAFSLICVGMAISFYAMFQFVTDSSRVWNLVSPYKHRGMGTYICPNHLAGFLELLLPLALAYTVTGRVKPLTRVLLGYSVLVMLGGIIVTVSRGGWLATFVSLLAFVGILLFQRGYRLPALLAMVSLIIVAFLIVPSSFALKMRLRKVVTDRGTVEDSMRFTLWRPAYRMWQDHLWWGVGPGHFDVRFRNYRPEGVQRSPDRAHNDYLNSLADWGIVGTALVASAWVMLGIGVTNCWRSVRLSSGDLGKRSGSNKFAFVVGAGLGLVAILVHSCLDFNMQIPANAIVVVVFMALISSHIRFATERWWHRPGLAAKVALAAILVGGVAYLAPQGWRQASEFVWLYRAERAPIYSASQIDLLKHAYAIEPLNSDTAFYIAEALRHQSMQGSERANPNEAPAYRQLAQQAMQWYQRSMALNPWDSRSFCGYGWCLDWLDRQSESPTYFSRAEELDPNNYFNLNDIGIHYVQIGDFAAARPWFERSLRLEDADNLIARNYLQLANLRLLEAATNEIAAKLYSLPH